MEMQQVRYFVALCETLNFTRAAERCNVSQPSLTRAIKLLEDELGGPLFHRERNNTHLTELGRRVEPHLRRAAEAVASVRSEAGAFAKLSAPVLRLGVGHNVVPALLLDLIARFMQAHPTAEIALPGGTPDELLENLRRGDVEIVVVPHVRGEPDEFHYAALAADGPQLVLPAGHRLAALTEVPLAELVQETLICLQPCHYWDILAPRLAEAGTPVRPRVAVARPLYLLEAVRSGIGIGLISRHQPVGEGLVGRALTCTMPGLEVALTTKRGRLYSPPVRAFVELALAPRRAQSVSMTAAAA
jgi:DNA-binding transcriptional LysR family regulator